MAAGPGTANTGKRQRPGLSPETWNRAYAAPTHWRHLSADSKTWSREITNAAYARAAAGLKIERRELHRRLARRWRIVAGLNARGEQFVKKALAFNPLPKSLDDLHFLQTSFRVYQPFTEALAEFHGGLEQYFSTAKDNARIKRDFEQALEKARQAQALAARAFPLPVDSMGGEVGLIRTYSTRLVEAIEEMVRGL